MPRRLLAAAVQLAAHSRASFQQAWPHIAHRTESAAASGAELIVLPEGSLPAYVLGYAHYEGGEIEAALDALRDIAKRHRAVIVAGAARTQGERALNSAVVIDRDGAIAGYADKHFLWHFDRQWFAPADHIAPVQTSIGSIGALVCADGRIPTISRTLVDQGAEMLVMPTAWVTSGRDPAHLENAQADLLARVRARENGVPFVAANKCGTELNCVAYCGKSQIVAADGSLAAIAPQDVEETIVSTIVIGELRPYRRRGSQTLPEAPDSKRRFAIAARAARDGDDDLLRILEADACIYAGDENAVDDGAVLDPGGLVEARMAGKTLAVWRTSYDPQWQVTFARARALELRMYVVVIDTARSRAYAIDPDGSVMCGTFDGYELASFVYDPEKTRQTAVAPGTDILHGLQRAGEHAI
ncbi:MAG TPA: carbon-nitrogen hydrolase family protein [Candidatus Baltobacteraceae bacterium]